jgi:ketosteroid isomerase-like protein
MTQKESISAETLKAIADAFNAHDLDAIMEFFSDDWSLDTPRGPESWGQCFIGKKEVREAIAARFKGLPDVQYSQDRHWVSGDTGVSEWLLTGTTPDRAGSGCVVATTGSSETGRLSGRTPIGRLLRSKVKVGALRWSGLTKLMASQRLVVLIRKVCAA